MAAGRVLIVGGGIAGLSLSLALRDSRWQAELIEREPGQDSGGAGLAVQPNAIRALHQLGAGAGVERAGSATGTAVARGCATSASVTCGPGWARSSASAGPRCTTRCAPGRTAAGTG